MREDRECEHSGPPTYTRIGCNVLSLDVPIINNPATKTKTYGVPPMVDIQRAFTPLFFECFEAVCGLSHELWQKLGSTRKDIHLYHDSRKGALKKWYTNFA